MAINEHRRIFVISKKKLLFFMAFCLYIPFIFLRVEWFLTVNDTTFTGCTPTFNSNHLNWRKELRLLPKEDLKQLVDIHDFGYIMQQPPCSSSITALMLVHTAPWNYRRRLLIRNTWGQAAVLRGTPLRLLFLLGAAADGTLQQELRNENDVFQDMVQGNFVDDYQNMTYKHTMAFKWFIYNCANAHVLFKLDDDVLVNIYQLLEYVMYQQPQLNSTKRAFDIDNENRPTIPVLKSARQLFQHPQCLLGCSEVIQQSPIRRTFRSKWRVSYSEYPGYFFPRYCSGYALIYSADVVLRLYKELQTSKFFWIDDVYITGMLARRLRIQHTSLSRYVMSRGTLLNLLMGRRHLADMEFIFISPYIKEEHRKKLWSQNELSLRRHIY